MIPIAERLTEAERFRLCGRSEDALMLYHLVLDINPRNGPALKGMAEVLQQQGNLKDALQAATAAAALLPSDIETLKLLAGLLAVAGEPVREAAIVEQIVTLDPCGPSTALFRADSSAANGDLTMSERILVDALHQEPENTSLIMALSRLYFSLGMVEDALQLAGQAVQLASGDETCLVQLADHLELLGDHRAALAYREKVLMIAPSNIMSIVRLADCYARCGEISEARRLAKRAIGLRPDVLPAWQVAVHVAILDGEADAILKRFAEIARTHPSRIDAMICLADGYRAMGRHAVALKLLAPLLDHGKLPSVQGQLVRSKYCEVALATGDLAAAAGLVPKSNGSESGAEHAPLQVVIPPLMAVNEVIPLIRLGLRRHTDRAVTFHGPLAFQDLFDLIDQTSFKVYGGRDPVPQGLPLPGLIGIAKPTREKLSEELPYIKVSAGQRTRWREALEKFPKPHIALAWNASRPGLLLDDLLPLTASFNGTFVSVIWGEGRHQLADAQHIVDAGAWMTGMDDLAAALAECDAALGPDCLPLHVAGAMNRRGLVLVQPGAPWYWHDNEGMSSWYPAVTVARTVTTGHWAIRRDDLADQISEFLTQVSGDTRELASSPIGQSSQREAV